MIPRPVAQGALTAEHWPTDNSDRAAETRSWWRVGRLWSSQGNIAFSTGASIDDLTNLENVTFQRDF
jgi:hypothetical protein